MSYTSFEYLMGKDTKELEKILEKKRREWSKRQENKTFLVGHILYLQSEIEKT